MANGDCVTVQKFKIRNPFRDDDGFALVKRGRIFSDKNRRYAICRIMGAATIVLESFTNLRKAARRFKDYRAKYVHITVAILLIFSPAAGADPVKGKATYYTEASAKAEGTSGIWTASGERFDEKALTCAMRSRDFGAKRRVTNLDNGRSIVCRLNDFGPGRKAAARGVVIDLTPAAYDALGGLRGTTAAGVRWGEIQNIRVETV